MPCGTKRSRCSRRCAGAPRAYADSTEDIARRVVWRLTRRRRPMPPSSVSWTIGAGRACPFYLRSGKHLAAKTTELAIQFKHVPHLFFPPLSEAQIAPNLLSLCLQPDEGCTCASRQRSLEQECGPAQWTWSSTMPRISAQQPCRGLRAPAARRDAGRRLSLHPGG